jgi:acid phosphatase
MNFKFLPLSIVLAGALAGCSGMGGTSQLSPGANVSLQRADGGSILQQAYTTKYVQLVIFENTSYNQIIGNPSAPYMNGLAKKWASMTDSHAITHPSEPNYLALFSGSTQGINSDVCPVTFGTASLGSALIAAGLSFTGYAESMPRNGFLGCMAVPDKLPSGWLYMRKHVPWPDFTKVPRSDSVVYPGPISKPQSSFIWITPNMCNDIHDCPIATGDKWASKNLPKLIAWDAANHGVLILTFDENGGSAGNQIVTILAGNVNPGKYNQNVNHYSVLRTIEDIFNLKPLGQSASAKPIAGVVK